MATYTSKFNLKKPASTDTVLVADINNNMDIIDAELNGSRPLYVYQTSVNSLPLTITNSKITANMICPPGFMRLNTPTAMQGPWTITTADGSVTVDGNIIGSTNIYLWLVEKMT